MSKKFSDVADNIFSYIKSFLARSLKFVATISYLLSGGILVILFESFPTFLPLLASRPIDSSVKI